MTRAFALLLLLATLAPTADAQSKKGGITFELMGENPTVLIGQEDHFTDYGAVCLDEVRHPTTHAPARVGQYLTHKCLCVPTRVLVHIRTYLIGLGY